MRELKFWEAVSEATVQAMEADERVVVLGPGVTDAKGVYRTTLEAALRFPARVLETPLSEAGITGAAVGMAMRGLRPVVVHMRCDFLLGAMDQMVNLLAKWRWLAGASAPVVVRAVVGAGWGQGGQHSQMLAATFAHFPGLNVLVPATPRDAKGLLVAALAADSPTLILEHKALFDQKGQVPEEVFTVPIGKANLCRYDGLDVTIVAVGSTVGSACEAAEALQTEGVGASVIDLRSVRPMDLDMVRGSVGETGRLVVVDPGWPAFGVAAEVIACVAEAVPLLAPAVRVGFPFVPCPASPALERAYYPGAKEIEAAVRRVTALEFAGALGGGS